jgi:hypothetical protein
MNKTIVVDGVLSLLAPSLHARKLEAYILQVIADADKLLAEMEAPSIKEMCLHLGVGYAERLTGQILQRRRDGWAKSVLPPAIAGITLEAMGEATSHRDYYSDLIYRMNSKLAKETTPERLEALRRATP